jgi:hypothetical protein
MRTSASAESSVVAFTKLLAKAVRRNLATGRPTARPSESDGSGRDEEDDDMCINHTVPERVPEIGLPREPGGGTQI